MDKGRTTLEYGWEISKSTTWARGGGETQAVSDLPQPQIAEIMGAGPLCLKPQEISRNPFSCGFSNPEDHLHQAGRQVLERHVPTLKLIPEGAPSNKDPVSKVTDERNSLID